MTTIFDRFRDELDTLGDRVRDAIEASRLHLERSSLIGLRSKAAYKLGMLVYRKERGGEVSQAEMDALLARLDDITAKIQKIDRDLDEMCGETVSVEEKPAPPAQSGEAEVS